MARTGKRLRGPLPPGLAIAGIPPAATRRALILIAGLALLALLGPRAAPAATPIGGEVAVSGAAEDDFVNGPRIAWAGNRYVVVWWSEDPDGLNSYFVYKREFSATGAPLGPASLVSNTTEAVRRFVDVAGMPDDLNYVIVWANDRDEPPGELDSGDDVLMRRYATGSVGPIVTVSALTEAAEAYPAVALTAGAEAIVSWYHLDDDDTESKVVARSFATGWIGDVVPDTGGYETISKVAALPDGRFAVAWDHETSATAGGISLFAANGAPLGSAPLYDFGAPLSLASTPSGHLVATGDPLGTGPGYALWRRFDADLSPAGSGSLPGHAADYPSVAAAGDGSFVLSYLRTAEPALDDGVVVRRFAADGTPLTGELLASQPADDGQRHTDVAARPSGGFAVVWYDDESHPNASVRARFYSTSTADDTVPPNTTITFGPAAGSTVKTKKKSVVARFGFTSSEAGSSFRCRMTGKLLPGPIKAWHACTSPRAYKLVAASQKRKRTFSVRATDSAGNTDPTPATRTFKVKRRR